MTRTQAKLAQSAACEIRHDATTRQLYATDASIYQIVPAAVAFPRTAEEAAGAMVRAAEEGLAVIPRGGGTGLAGGALGDGLVVDCARHNKAITDLDLEAGTVRVGAGVVLDQLNAFLKPHHLCFGPDVATSSRATLGGMIGNNSSGARAPVYGVTIDHVAAVELVMADGRITTVELGEGLGDAGAQIAGIIRNNETLIRETLHEGVIKRWPGYGLDRFLRSGGDLVKIFGGSEGTLGAVFSATLRLSPVPREKGVGLLFFHSVEDAMQASVDILDLEPAAIEHIDDVLYDQTRGQMAFQAARDLLELDAKPCKSVLIVEFYGQVPEKLAALESRRLGYRQRMTDDPKEMALVWNLRKAGLTLLTGRPGDAKPTAGIEDVAVPPAKLPEYVQGLREIMAPMGLDASFYGHAASGLLHVRPVVDLHLAEDIAKFRKLADGVSALTKQFKGAIAAEHGVGIARTEYMPEHLGELLPVMRAIKTVLDPKNRLNPGKIFPDGRFRFDTNLRQGAGNYMTLPFKPVLQFAAKDWSFIGNLEQCNGNGACKKLTPTMCPTYQATGEEIMTTRGRANAIRAAIEGRLPAEDPLQAPGLDEALKFCLSCKACKRECPSSVDMALLKAEVEHAQQQRRGTPLAKRVFSRPDLLGRLAAVAPGLANASLKNSLFRQGLEWLFGIDKRRPLPPYAADTFDLPAKQAPRDAHRGPVNLWDDCFVRHNTPEIGEAAVKVLEAAGFEVRLVAGRECCGRPAFSTGRLDVARRMADHNLALFEKLDGPLVFLEASCYSMFSDDYVELAAPGAEIAAERSRLFEDFILDLLAADPGALRFREGAAQTVIHGHCHAKALTNTGRHADLAAAIPGNKATVLDTGCCGMAGSFGASKEKYDLSLAVAQPLTELLAAAPPDACVVASGTSCRHQIEHLTDRTPLHMAQLLAQALGDNPAEETAP